MARLTLDMRKFPARLTRRVICVVLAALAGPLAAQNASQVTPETFTPPLQRLAGSIEFAGGTGTQAPPGAEKFSIRLSGVGLQDGLSEMGVANAAFETRLTRGTIPVSEIFNAAADLEAAYARAGYVLSRVVLPQQSLRDGGRLSVVVVNGFVEQVDDSNVNQEVKPRIAELTDPLVGKPGLKQDVLERQLLLAGDVAGVSLGSALATGQRPGGTVILLDSEYRKVTGFVGVDSLAPKVLGSPTFHAGVEVNSALSFGETFYGRLSASADQVLAKDPRYRILALGAVVPIGASGLLANAELTMSDTTPNDKVTPTRSNFDRQSLRLIYPWIRSRNTNVSAQFSLDRQQDSLDLITATGRTPIYRDRVTVLRAGADVSRTHADGAVSQVNLTFSQGVDMLGARTAASAVGGTPLSRLGADATFSKLTGSFAHDRALTDRLSLAVSGRFQTSFGSSLVTSETFGITGSRELSAFDAGAVRGDSGWVLRGELASHYDYALAGRSMLLSPYVFAGVGAVNIIRPTAVEKSVIRGKSYGIGVDIAAKTGSTFESSTLRMEFGRGERDDGGLDSNKFSVSGNFRF